MADLIGYWFRFGNRSKVLHLVKWSEAADGAHEFETACGTAMARDTTPRDRARMILEPTARAAMEAADPNQRAHLCRRCGGRVMAQAPT